MRPIALLLGIFLTSMGLISGQHIVTKQDFMDRPCEIPRNKCRLSSSNNTLGEIVIHVECECLYTHNEEDRSFGLQKLANVPCSYIPKTDSSPKVSYSSLKIKSCRADRQSLPIQLVQQLRRSNHFHIEIIDSPGFQFPQVSKEIFSHLPKVTANIKNSVLKGFGVGLFSNCSDVSVNISNSKLDVIDSYSFSSYSNGARVVVDINDSEISRINKLAFWMPKYEGVLTIRNSRITEWMDSGYSGGHSLLLDNVIIGHMNTWAINMQGVNSLSILRSTIGVVDKDCIRYAPFSEDTFVENDNDVDFLIISQNQFLKLHGEAFKKTCKVTNLTWTHNIIREIIEPPLRLQGNNCNKKRNWLKSVTNTTFYCIQNCQDFEIMDEKVCALYTSGVCITSETKNYIHYTNYSDTLLHVVSSNCPQSPINETCGFNTTFDRWNYGRSLEYVSHATSCYPKITLLAVIFYLFL